MSDIEQPRDRLDVIEERVAQLTVDAATTRLMAAMADRDVAEYRRAVHGHTRVLNALRETQVEHGKTLAQHGKTLAEHGKTLAEHTKTLARHTKLLEGHSRTLATHGEKLDEHGGILRTLASGQAAIMEHLGITMRHGDEEPPD